MGRAIVREPQVFLMDEPLSNLDAKLRVQTRMEVADLQAWLGVTTVYVTHDQVEAMTLGHRVAVLDHGVLQQCDTPKRFYDHPANLFVVGFIGSPAMNLFEVAVADGEVRLGGVPVGVSAEVRSELTAGETVTDGVRPEHAQLGDDGIPGEVTVIEELGSEAYVNVAFDHQDERRTIFVRTVGGTTLQRGDRVHVRPGDVVHVFDGDGQRVGPA